VTVSALVGAMEQALESMKAEGSARGSVLEWGWQMAKVWAEVLEPKTATATVAVSATGWGQVKGAKSGEGKGLRKGALLEERWARVWARGLALPSGKGWGQATVAKSAKEQVTRKAVVLGGN